MGNLSTGEDITPETFQHLFKAFDKDGNGVIEKSEMLHYVIEHF